MVSLIIVSIPSLSWGFLEVYIGAEDDKDDQDIQANPSDCGHSSSQPDQKPPPKNINKIQNHTKCNQILKTGTLLLII